MKQCWERGIRLAKQTNDKSIISEIEGLLLSALETDYPNAPFMHLWVSELIKNNLLCLEQHESIAKSLFKKAKLSRTEFKYRQACKYLLLAEKIFRSTNNEKCRLDCVIMLAE